MLPTIHLYPQSRSDDAIHAIVHDCLILFISFFLLLFPKSIFLTSLTIVPHFLFSFISHSLLSSAFYLAQFLIFIFSLYSLSYYLSYLNCTHSSSSAIFKFSLIRGKNCLVKINPPECRFVF